MSNYLREAVGPVPQSEPLDERQVENSAGGFSYEVDALTQLRRFLILGTEGGSYYANQRDLTAEQVQTLRRLVKAAGLDVVKLICEVSEGGLAPKNDPALLALALASAEGDDPSRQAAFAALPRVARTATHLFHWLAFRDDIAGWGRGARRAVGDWYAAKNAEKLAYQMVKYRQRDGWTHRDALRLSHAPAPTEAHKALYDFACDRTASFLPLELRLVEGYRMAMVAESPRHSAKLIREYGLPREAVNPDHLTDAEVWEALLEDMPLTAMIRNLANMTRAGVIAPSSAGALKVAETLADEDRLRKARVHPIQVLSALVTYAQGHGARGDNTWTPVASVVDALDAAFYASFRNVEPANKRTMLALDVSGSMSWGEIAGVPGLTPRVASGAMAMVALATEPATETVAFSHALTPLPLSKRQRLDDVIHTISHLPFGGTDCSLPMLWAKQNGREVDTFIVYTDSETWAGRVHPMAALRDYRQASGINAKLIVVGMVANRFSIADPGDGLDVVGFDASAPVLMNAFARGDL